MAALKQLNDFAEQVKMDFVGPGGGLVYSGGEFWRYEAGAWARFSVADRERLEHLMWKRNSAQEQSKINYAKDKNDMWTVLKASNTQVGKVEFDAEPMLVFPNGTLILRKNKFVKHSAKHYATRSVAIEYKPDAECPRWEAALERVFGDLEEAQRASVIHFLQEFWGVSIVRGPEIRDNRDLRTGLIVDGPTKTAKTQVTEILTQLLGGYGPHRVVAPTMKLLSGRFGWQAILNAQAIISQDSINGNWQIDAQMLKQLATGENVIVDRKNLEPVDFSYNGPVVFTANGLPQVLGHDDAISNRYCILEMTRQFGPKDRRAHLEGHASLLRLLEASGELAGVLNWALVGYDRAIAQGEYTIPSHTKMIGEKFRAENDPIYDFLRECCEYDAAVKNPSELVAALACEYAERQHRQHLPKSKAIRLVPRTVRDAWPGVVVDRVRYGDKDSVRSLVGLKLNNKGKAILAAASDRGVLIVRQYEKKANSTSNRGGH